MILNKKAISAVAVFSVPMSILAQSPNDAKATIFKDFSCGGFVPTPDGGSAFPLSTDQSHSVVTPSGNTKLICDFNIPDGQQPSKATHAENFLCGTPMGITTDSIMIATPGGKAVLTCEIKHA